MTPKSKGPALPIPGLGEFRRYALTQRVQMNNITMHGSITVNGRTVVVHVGDGEATATVDGARFNVRSLWQLYQLLRLLV